MAALPRGRPFRGSKESKGGKAPCFRRKVVALTAVPLMSRSSATSMGTSPNSVKKVMDHVAPPFSSGAERLTATEPTVERASKAASTSYAEDVYGR